MKIGIVGLGYVGLPLACLFASKYEVVGFDINEEKIKMLNAGVDYTNELADGALHQTSLVFSNEQQSLKQCNIIIVSVPTDIDEYNLPDLRPLQKASEMIGSCLQKGMIVVFESTVYPGLTEEECIPILEKCSGLIWKKDFNVGYSPERINSGDKLRPVQKILKIVSGDTDETLELLAELYGSVIEAGIYKAPNIKTAEAAKVIENAQRDLNIAFMNELAIIFDKMNIDTGDVLKAAGTKWNFMPFEPGLVGGHCIGVDPYYLSFKAQKIGYSPNVINAGRSLNNQMSSFVADKILKLLIAQKKVVASCRVLLLGCTFKENVPDIRNSKAFDIAKSLVDYNIEVDIVDTVVANDRLEFNNKLILNKPSEGTFYDAIVLAVKHNDFINYNLEYLASISVDNQLNLFDIKSFYDRHLAVNMAKHYWRL